jgi:hypothetical protein
VSEGEKGTNKAERRVVVICAHKKYIFQDKVTLRQAAKLTKA